MLISLLVLVLIFGLIFWLVQSVLPLPPPFKMVALIVLVVIMILALLDVGGIGRGLLLR